MRSFPSLGERDRVTKEFYEGPEWTFGLEEAAMPMLDRYDVVVTRATPGALVGSLAHGK